MTQPTMRLWGRLRHGLTPWRSRGSDQIAFPLRRSWRIWSESWRPLDRWIAALEARLLEAGAVVRRGGHFDRWDLEVRGFLGSGRLWTTVEEHGEGRQLVRFRFWPRPTSVALPLLAFFALAAIGAVAAGVAAAEAVLGLALAIVLGVMARDYSRAAGSAKRAADGLADAVMRAGDTPHEDAPRAAAPPDVRPQLEQATTGQT
jgi:hypothetical protein